MSETFADKIYPAESNRSFALEIAKITESERGRGWEAAREIT